MALCVLYSRAVSGIHAPLVTVEVHLSAGLPQLSLVGLPELAVRESKDRVRAAILNSQFHFPDGRVTINLAPADLPKEGGRFDLPIALGILGASGQIPTTDFAECEFLGELALSGALRPVTGVLSAALAARSASRELILPEANAEEAGLVDHLSLRAASHLLMICDHFSGKQTLPIHPPTTIRLTKSQQHPDLRDVQGQQTARRALEIAAAGGHSLLLYGPPGTGKSMLASRLPSILPPMTSEEALESTLIYSIAGKANPRLQQGWIRPFRAPHHSASATALVGGGSIPRPGEISLAHHGVLFLDELPEFDRRTLEVLREPIERGYIHIARAAQQVEFPARFQLIVAMNPCPCGYLGDDAQRCRCTPRQIQQYRARLSGPLIDRIDMHVEMARTGLANQLLHPPPIPAESSAVVASRVIACRQRQYERAGTINALLDNEALKQYCVLDEASKKLLEQALDHFGLSARAYHRIIKVARTIADLANTPNIERMHLQEAIGYRRFDRQQ